MTASTKRFTINQHWQQISKGNVTLIGCNTAATYHVYVGTDAPNGDSDFVSDTLAQPTPYNFDTPVWVKLNVNNQIDEADMIAIGVLAEQVKLTQTAFSQFLNCSYDGTKLSYTGGLNSGQVSGYEAQMDNPKAIQWIANTSTPIRFFIGNVCIGNYDPTNDISFVASGTLFRLGKNALPVEYSDGDIINITIQADGIHLENSTSKQTTTIMHSVASQSPAHLLVLVDDISPITIKAI